MGNPYEPGHPQQPPRYQPLPNPYAQPAYPPPGYPVQPPPQPAAPPPKRRRKGLLIALLAVVLLAAGGTAAALVLSGGDDAPGAIKDLTITATDRDGEARVSFTRPDNAKTLVLRCTYTTAGKAAQPCELPQVDPSAKTVDVPLANLPAGEKATVSIQACNHALNAQASDADKYCSDPATTTVVTNAPPGTPTEGACKPDADGTLTYTWAKPTTSLPSPVTGYQVSFDGALATKITETTFSKVVPKDGRVHTAQVAAVDARGVAGTPAPITCTAPSVRSAGTFIDPLIDRKARPGLPLIDLTRVDWKRDGNMLTVTTTFSTKGKHPFTGLMIDADADGTTGKHGMTCPDKADDFDFGAEYIYLVADHDLIAATGVGLCANTAKGDPGKATFTDSGSSWSVTVDLSTIIHDPDKIVIRALAGTDSDDGKTQGVFQDYAPKPSGQGLVIPLPGDGD